MSYSIRRVVAEARKAEAAGKKIYYLNTGDPVACRLPAACTYGGGRPAALRNGENGYGPSVGLLEAREAVAAENTRAAGRSMPIAS